MLSLSLPLLFILPILLYAASFPFAWIRNAIVARRIGLPVVRQFVDQNHFVWMIASVASRPFLKRHLPTSWYNRITLAIYGWEHHQKLAPFVFAASAASTNTTTGEKAAAVKGGGKSFLLAGCGRLELWTCDPEMAKEILGRPREFTQFDFTELFVGQFGANVLSTDGDVWARHRRIVASAVTERVSPVVWGESIRQTKGLVEEVFEKSGSEDGNSAETRRLFDMMKKITIHVLSGAGMGTTRSWNETGEEEEQQQKEKKERKSLFKLSYIDAVKMINENMTGPLILPIKLLVNWPSFMPGYQNLRKLGYAKQEFPLRTKEMLALEKDRAAEEKRRGNTEPRNNVMSMLISASEQGDEESQKSSKGGTVRKGPALSDDEIVGNLYVFTAAGFDTTANTLSYALVLLARYPKWQSWIFEEIDALLPEDEDDSKLLDYAAVFPKVTRVLAFMFETLRLFPPLSHLVKMVKHQPRTVTTCEGEKLTLPAPLTIYVNLVALHLDPTVWRDLNLPESEKKQQGRVVDPEDAPGRHAAHVSGVKDGAMGDEWAFRPSRWINPPQAVGNDDGSNNASETLFQPPRNTFLPWSMGPRVCPGQRMAQVEFTAIFLTLFRDHRIEAVKGRIKDNEKGNSDRQETDQEVNARLDKLMEESMSILTLEMQVYNLASEAEERGLKLRLVKRR